MKKLSKIRQRILTDAFNGFSIILPNKLRLKGSDFLAILALGIVSIVWGTTWVVSKEGVRYIPALQMAGLRQFLGGSLYLLYFIIRKYPLPEKKDLFPLLVLSVLNFVFSNGLSTWGVKYISAGLGSIIGAIFPLWIVIIGILGDKTAPPNKAISGLIIGFLGICIIFYDHLDDFINPDFRFGIMLSLIATWTWAFGTIYTKRHAKVFNPYFGLGFQMTLSGIILSLVAMTDPAHTPILEIPEVTWLAIFYLVIFGSLIGFICYLYALQHLPTEQTAIYAYINPIVALITGWIFLDEQLNPVIIGGCLVTLLGIYLVNSSFKS